ncbi:MAG TPA: hypothetical protein VII73_04285 [Caulobacteraceae bacterium]
MKQFVAAGMAGLLMFTAQAAVAQDSVNAPPGSHAYCDQRWDSMVANHSTGDQTRGQFMRGCMSHEMAGGPNDTTLALVGLGGLALAITALAFTHGDHNNNPTSP